MTNEKQGFGQRIQNFMSSYRGKVIMNYAYSWGAAVVIAGTLFKLTHLPGANLMLWIGMGTEVLVFFLSAFDLPQKSAGEAASASVAGGIVIGGVPGSVSAAPAGGSAGQGGEIPASAPVAAGGTVSGGGTIVIGGGFGSGGSAPAGASLSASPELEESTQAYVEKLKEVTEQLGRFAAQAESLSHDAEQMQHLKQNLAGINAIYEMQLRSASAQMGTIDQVHEETRRMARQIEELNAVYARMLQAMQPKAGA